MTLFMTALKGWCIHLGILNFGLDVIGWLQATWINGCIRLQHCLASPKFCLKGRCLREGRQIHQYTCLTVVAWAHCWLFFLFFLPGWHKGHVPPGIAYQVHLLLHFTHSQRPCLPKGLSMKISHAVLGCKNPLPPACFLSPVPGAAWTIDILET